MNADPASSEPPRAVFTALAGFPEVLPGADLVGLLAHALHEATISLLDGDIVVLASKIVAKAEGRLVDLAQVTPSPRAIEVAGQTGKDPRLVELILGESEVISRIRPGLLIVRHKLGFTSANAGIDHSNVCQSADSEMVLLLPQDPDATAATR